jgi:hypothetical protein
MVPEKSSTREEVGPVINTAVVITRLSMSAVGSSMTAHAAAVTAYKPFGDARNDAQGGADAWGPPV